MFDFNKAFLAAFGKDEAEEKEKKPEPEAEVEGSEEEAVDEQPVGELPEGFPEGACGEPSGDSFCIKNKGHDGKHAFKARGWIEQRLQGEGSAQDKSSMASRTKKATQYSTQRLEFDIAGGGASTLTSILTPDILKIPPGESFEFVINGGEVFTVYYDESPARGDNGRLVRGDTTGEYEVLVGDLIGGKVILRQHVSPHGSSGYGNSGAKQYAAEQVAGAIANHALGQGRYSSRTAAKWYVHVNAVRPNGVKDTFYTESFDSEAEARKYLDEVQGSDEMNVDGPATVWEAEIQGPVEARKWGKIAAASIENLQVGDRVVVNDGKGEDTYATVTQLNPSGGRQGDRVEITPDDIGLDELPFLVPVTWVTKVPREATRKTASMPPLQFNLGGPYAYVHPQGYENMKLGWDLFAGKVEILREDGRTRIIATDINNKTKFKKVAEEFFAQVFVEGSKTAANPYTPEGNPFVDPPVTPGTPDEALDGPNNPRPYTLDMDTPMTTRPRQMPDANNDDVPEETEQPPGTVASLIPIVCMACQRRYSVSKLAATLKCVCGSSDLDLDDLDPRQAMEGDPPFQRMPVGDPPLGRLPDNEVWEEPFDEENPGTEGVEGKLSALAPSLKHTAYSRDDWRQLTLTFFHLTGEHLAASSLSENMGRKVLDRSGSVPEAAKAAAATIGQTHSLMDAMLAYDEALRSLSAAAKRDATAKRREMVRGIMKENPGLDQAVAMSLADQALKRYPVTKTALGPVLGPDTVEWNNLRHVDAKELQPGDVFLNPGIGTVYHVGPDGTVQNAGLVGLNPADGYLFEVVSNDGTTLSARRLSDGQTVSGAIPAGAKKLKVVSRKKTADISPEELGVKVGDIFDSHWGYDQTNVDFYEVVGLTGASVRLRKLKQTRKEDAFMSGTTEPLPGQYVGEPFLKRLQKGYRGEPYVNLTSYSGASLWDGTPQRYSSYA